MRTYYSSFGDSGYGAEKWRIDQNKHVLGAFVASYRSRD